MFTLAKSACPAALRFTTMRSDACRPHSFTAKVCEIICLLYLLVNEMRACLGIYFCAQSILPKEAILSIIDLEEKKKKNQTKSVAAGRHIRRAVSIHVRRQLSCRKE